MVFSMYALLPFIVQLVSATTTTTTNYDYDYGRCSYSQFQCNNGQCIPSHYVCDKFKHCTDGSDEYSCSTDTPTITWNGLKKLHCDGVVYDLEGIIIQQPAGVCAEDTGSMWKCNSFNNLAKVYYENNNCTGNPIHITSFSSFAAQSGIKRYSITCCSRNQCDFGLIRTWDTIQCDDYSLDKLKLMQYTNKNSSGSAFSDNIKLINGCTGDHMTHNMAAYTLCSNGKLTKKIYNDNHFWYDNCDGMDYDIESVFDGQCNENRTIQVICGHAQDTCNYDGSIASIFVSGSVFGFCLFCCFMCCCYRHIRERSGKRFADTSVQYMTPELGLDVQIKMVQNNGSYY